MQRRREFPTRFTQRLQIVLQNNIIGPALGGRRPKAPLFMKMLQWPLLRRIPGRLLALGIRPEHIRTPDNQNPDARCPGLGFHPRRRDLRCFQPHFIERLAYKTGRFCFFDEITHISQRGGLSLGYAHGRARIEKCIFEDSGAGDLSGRPDRDLRESAIASILPSFIAVTAASTPAKSIWAALGVALLAARKVAVFATPPIPTPLASASFTELIFERGCDQKGAL